MRPPFAFCRPSAIHYDARPCIPLAGTRRVALVVYHHHLHRGDRGDGGAKDLGRDADRLGRIVAERAVDHHGDRLHELHYGRH